MKVRCSKCNKRYDHELYSGVCPACGEYARRGSAVLEGQNEVRSGEIRVSTNSDLEVKARKRIELSVKWIIIIFIAGMLSFFLVEAYIVLPNEVEDIYQKQIQSEPEIVVGEFNQRLAIYQAWVEINNPEPLEVAGIEAPKGYTYIKVPYQIYNQDSLSYTEEHSLKVYLEVGGYFLKPMNPYDFPEYLVENSKGYQYLSSDKYSYSFQRYSDPLAEFIFMVPDELVATNFYIHQGESEPDNILDIGEIERVYAFQLGEDN